MELCSLVNLAASHLPSARKFISAAYVKALVSWWVFLLLFFRYSARKMSVAALRTMLSANSPKCFQALPGVTQSLFNHPVFFIENVFQSYFYVSLFTKFRYKKLDCRMFYTFSSESFSTLMWLTTTFRTCWLLTSYFLPLIFAILDANKCFLACRM